jgi:hypothetical protein
VTVPRKTTDRGSASGPATFLGITAGTLLGWLVAALICRLLRRRRAGGSHDALTPPHHLTVGAPAGPR